MNSLTASATSIFLIIVSFFIHDNHTGIWMMGAGMGFGVYSLVIGMDFGQRGGRRTNFSPPEMPPVQRPVRQEVTVRHEHHNYNYTQCTEGVEIKNTLPDGRSVSIRHVRKWQ